MKYQQFVFEGYSFDPVTSEATFSYSFDHERKFTERVIFSNSGKYDKSVLDRAVWLAFLVAGTSYYKCFPTQDVYFKTRQPSDEDVRLLNAVYTNGLSQFMFENCLTLEDMPTFTAGRPDEEPLGYANDGVLVLQSGGKDSLLLGELLREKNINFETMYMSSGAEYPRILDDVNNRLPRRIRRIIDRSALHRAVEDGGLNGHVPVTHITLCFALMDAILHRENTVLVAIGREGNEAHGWIGELPINHQWSKTWEAEQLFAHYVHASISPDILVGSPLRGLSELRIAELFVQKAWVKYGHRFSSCNIANYKQGQSNDELVWCGECPKCANSFLLFAPFVEPNELADLFGGQNLFIKPSLTDTFKGLLGIDNVMKPFECVGEIDELRAAYHMARQYFGDTVYSLPFYVPNSTFDYLAPGTALVSLDTIARKGHIPD